MVQLIELGDHQPFEDDAGDADNDGGQDQRAPIADAEIIQQHPGGESAHHELRAMREIDHVEHAEDHREPQREQRVERPVDQAEKQLPEEQRRRYAEEIHVLVQLRVTRVVAARLS